MKRACAGISACWYLVRELVIAHAKPGLHKVYDLHAYLDEKRECLALWEARLRRIVGTKGL